MLSKVKVTTPVEAKTGKLKAADWSTCNEPALVSFSKSTEVTDVPEWVYVKPPVIVVILLTTAWSLVASIAAVALLEIVTDPLIIANLLPKDSATVKDAAELITNPLLASGV